MELHEEIDKLVKDIWKNEMKKDYNGCVFWEESVLKTAFYHHLRQKFRGNKNLVLYPEMRVRTPKEEPLRIDLAIVEIPECGAKNSAECERIWEQPGSCIERLIAAFEFKHWDRIYRKPLDEAVRKLWTYFQKEGVYYFDDNSKDRKLLMPKLLYFGIVLDIASSLPGREEIIRKPDSFKELRLLIGGNVRDKVEFKCL